MSLIGNDYGKELISSQSRTMHREKMLALLCLIVSAACLFFPEWLKFLAVLPLVGSFFLDRSARLDYEEILYRERDKEKLANYLRESLTDYTMWVNPQLCNPHPHLLVIGPTGIFIIMITSKLSYGIKQTGDLFALAVQAAVQNLIPEYPLKTIIYFSEATLLKPAVGKVLIVSSLFALIKHIQDHNEVLSKDEIAALTTKFQSLYSTP